jgi:anti-sigma factor RsiW
MGDKDNELKVALRALADESKPNLGGHVTPEELTAYHDGVMSADDQGRVQDHLVLCRECAALLLDLAAFPALSQEGGRQIQPAEVATAWGVMQARLQREGALSVSRPSWRQRMNLAFSSTRVAYALAASLLVISLGLGLWTISLRRENQQLAASLRERRGAEERVIKSLDQASRQHESDIAELRRNIDELSQPQLNVPIADLYPRGFARNQGQAAATIDVPARVNLFTLVLNTAHDQTFPTYSLEIVDERSALVWQGRGLQKSALNNFTVSLARRLFPTGQYLVKLYGWRGERKRLVEEYAVRIRYQSER